MQIEDTRGNIFIVKIRRGGGGVTRSPRVKEEVGSIQINPYQRHPRHEAIFLSVSPYNKNKEGGGVTCCLRVKEEVGPNTNKPISKTPETRCNIFICRSLW